MQVGRGGWAFLATQSVNTINSLVYWEETKETTLRVFTAIWVLLIAPKSVQERREFSNKGMGKAGARPRWEMHFPSLCLPGAARTGRDGPGSCEGAQERENLTSGRSCDPGREMSFVDQEGGKGGGNAQDLQPLPGFAYKQLEQMHFVIFRTECWLKNQFILFLPKLKQKVSQKMRRKHFISAWEKCFNQPEVNRWIFLFFGFCILFFLYLVLLWTGQGFRTGPVQRLFILPSSFFY